MIGTEHQREISSLELAKWLEGQSGSWWCVDGDPLLTSEVDFPCPTEELAEALRRINREITVITQDRRRSDHGKELRSGGLDGLTDTNNPRKEKRILAAWKDSDVKWLLSEDKSMAEAACQSATEPIDAKAAD